MTLRTTSDVLKDRLMKMESVLAKKKVIVRREWTKDDVREMKSLAKQKVGLARIAKKLKRTPAATRVRASMLGVSLDTR